MTARGGLLERDGAAKAVAELVGAVSAGQASALFVVGEPGLGKTALLEHGRDLAVAAGLAAGFGRGHPMEEALPFGVLVQVLDAVGGSGLLREDQPGPARGDDRASRFFAVLRWLERRDGGPVLLVLDDLHWADADSLALAVFLCRRMPALRAGLLASLRPWPAAAMEAATGLAQEGCARLERLAPLTPAGAAALLAARTGRPVPGEVSRRAGRLCAGNPLLLEQAAMAIGRGEELPDADAAGTPLIGESLLLARFAGLSAPGLRCARAASVLGTRFVPQIAAQVAGLGDAEADAAVESLARSGLIEEGQGAEAGFSHPLFRQALYDDLGAAMRAQLHARAFAVFAARGADAAAAEHAVAANLAGDMRAVAVLERAGLAARRSGALDAAIDRLDAAVRLAAGRAGPGLLLAQGEALLTGGQPQRAVPVCQELLSHPDLPDRVRAEAMWISGRALMMTGDPARAAATFVEAARIAEIAHPAMAATILMDASLSATFTVGPKRALETAARARELAARLPPRLRATVDAIWGMTAVQAGDPAGIAAAESAAPWLLPDQARAADDEIRTPSTEWGLLNGFPFTMMLVERLEESDRAFAALRESAAWTSDPQVAALLVNAHGYGLYRMGRLDAALEAINEALSLTDLAPAIESFATVGRACIQLYRGDLADSAAWCERAQAGATARGDWNALLFVSDALGHRRLREGAADEACEHYARLEALVRQMGIGEPCLPAWPRHAIAAYLAAGRPGDAERVLASTEEHARPFPCRFPRIAVATGRAWLAEVRGDHDAAEAGFGQALALHQETDLPLEHAETLLAYGEFLRRRGEPTRARRVLAQAIEVAQAAQAGWLAGLAHAELRVAGGRRRRSGGRELTAQEDRVAALAATGASTPQIARQLSVSVSTVETHLERIYAKLDIHSRHELIARIAAKN